VGAVVQLVEVVSYGASCNLTLRADLAAITLKTANPLKLAQFLQASRVLQFREDWKIAEVNQQNTFYGVQISLNPRITIVSTSPRVKQWKLGSQ
jgi:hypothetical protein